MPGSTRKNWQVSLAGHAPTPLSLESGLSAPQGVTPTGVQTQLVPIGGPSRMVTQSSPLEHVPLQLGSLSPHG